jgi:hypothetical protein
MEPRSGTRRKIKPRCIVNYSTSRRPEIDAYGRAPFRAEENGRNTQGRMKNKKEDLTLTGLLMEGVSHVGQVHLWGRSVRART